MTSVKEHIKAIAAFGILITIFMAGFTLSASFWSSSNTGLQNDLRRSREELAQSRAEFEKLKEEYSHYRDSHSTDVALARQSAPVMQATDAAKTENPKVSNAGVHTEEISLRTGGSKSAESGEIVVSVIGIAYEGDPLRHKVTFAVGGPGAPTMTYEKQDIGAVVRWKKFEVRLLSADTFDARFTVTRTGSL